MGLGLETDLDSAGLVLTADKFKKLCFFLMTSCLIEWWPVVVRSAGGGVARAVRDGCLRRAGTLDFWASRDGIEDLVGVWFSSALGFLRSTFFADGLAGGVVAESSVSRSLLMASRSVSVLPNDLRPALGPAR